VSPWLTVLSYHRAAPSTADNEYDEGVVDVTPSALDEHLAMLRHGCDVITLAQLSAFVRGAKLPANPVLLTFDDGYLDNHDVVLPLLVRHGLTAVFFVATSYIEERRLFWWDHVNALLKRSRKEHLELTYPYAVRAPLGPSRAQRNAAIATVLRIIKRHYDLDLGRLLDHVSVAAEVAIGRDEERARADSLLMTWEHVRALRRAGMDVQSHTSTHRVLQTLSPTSLDRELRGSRRKLEDVLGERVGAISYPVGKPLRGAIDIRDAVRDAGYELGFSNCTGVNHTMRLDPLDTRRIAADTAKTTAQLEALIALPYLAP